MAPRLERAGALRQVDTLGELQASTPPGEAGLIVWDARDASNRVAELAALQLHSARFAIIVLDSAGADPWRTALKRRRIAALVPLPFDPQCFAEAFERALQEYHARNAVLGPGTEAARSPARRVRWQWIALGLAACAASAAVVWIQRAAAPGAAAPGAAAPALPPTAAAPGAPPSFGSAAAGSADTPAAGLAPAPAPPDIPAAATETAGATEEAVDGLLEKARQAMLERRFTEPPGENALTLYQSVLADDPGNGEARQGLERVAQILFARVDAALDERRFDLALAALESARSLSPEDPHLRALDARVESLRAQLGPEQIEAAVAARNFDRALQLLDEAARAKSLDNAQLDRLREVIESRRHDTEIARLQRLLAARLQQGRLLDPPQDSAAYYLAQARRAGASADQLNEVSQTLAQRLMGAARTALDQERAGDAARLIAGARAAGAPLKLLTAVQRDLEALREAQARERTLEAQTLELAQKKQAQGAIIASARAAIDAGDLGKAAALAQDAAALGPAGELDALNALLERQKQRSTREAAIAATSLTAIKPLKLEYPSAALARGTEGWVDLAYEVTAAGKVANISVLGASPPAVFDAAAKSALARVRYEPVVVDGEAVDIRTTLHVVFRLGNSVASSP